MNLRTASGMKPAAKGDINTKDPSGTTQIIRSIELACRNNLSQSFELRVLGNLVCPASSVTSSPFPALSFRPSFFRLAFGQLLLLPLSDPYHLRAYVL